MVYCNSHDLASFGRRKLQSKVKESDESLTELQGKYSSLDKAKHHMAAELEDVNLDLEKERNRAQGLEKKQKLVDKQITEWKSKYDDKEMELAQSQKEGHAASTEVGTSSVSVPPPM